MINTATVNRKSLRDALATVKACLPDKPLTEIEGCALIRVKGGVVSVVATDMIQEAVVSLQAAPGDISDFEVVPDLKKLEKVLTKTDTADVQLQYENGSGALRVSGAEGSGYVEIPTYQVSKIGRYDAPVSEGEDVGSVPTSVLAFGLSYMGSFLPETVGGNLKFEVATLNNGVLSGANGWNRRGFFVSKCLVLGQEVKFLQRFVTTLSKVLKHVVGDLRVILHKNSMVLVGEAFRYTCVRARHETPDPMLSYLQSSDPYLTLDVGKMVKALDKITIPDYSSAGAAVGVQVTVSSCSPGTKEAEMSLSLASTTSMKAFDTIKCIREGEQDGSPGLVVEKVIDYRMFKDMATEFPSKGETRVYMSNPSSRYFKFQGKFLVEDKPCVAVAVGSYSKVVAGGTH